MNNSQTYEKIVKVKNTGRALAKKISAIMGYCLFLSFWITAAVFNATRLIPLLTLGALSTCIIVLLTWKYLRLEYEYSFWYGRMGIAKIYGKCKRKALIETEIRDLLIIAPATEENISRTQRFDIEDRIAAVSCESADDIWLAVTGGKDERRILIFFEADERSLSILKTFNPHVFLKK